ncbi:MAG: DUF3619 family protein [Rhodocyclaceae bacterium]|jgi:hypothetical protein|nr:DUF3619 family protein [Rhodocyclaceae bacterium]
MEMTMRAGVRPDARKKVVPGFERQVAGYLDEAARTLPDDVSRRLAQARACALAGPLPPAQRLRLGVLGVPVLRSALLAAGVVFTFLFGQYWGMVSQVQEYRAVDTALLIDDLPIDAYLDPDFRAWLQRQEQES